MLGPKQEAQGALFYEFSIEDYVPSDHVLRAIDGAIDLSGVRPIEMVSLCQIDRA